MKRIILLLSVVLAIVLLSVCATAAPTPVSLAAPASAPQSVAGPASAPTAQLEMVRLAYGGPVPAIILLPLDVAIAQDYFKQEGLDVTMTRLPRASANSELLLGHVDFAGEVFNPSDTRLAGRAAESVTSMGRLPGFTLVVRSDLKDKIKSLADLKGQEIDYGGNPGIFPYLISKAGLAPDDVHFVEAGNVAEIAANMQKGVGVAAILVDPYTTQVLESGKGYALVDLATEADTVKWLGGSYQSVSLMTTADMIENHPQTVQKMTNAIVQALRYIASHSPADIAAILPADVVGPDKSLFVDAVQHDLPLFSRDGVVNQSDVQSSIDVNRAIGAIKPDQPIDIQALYTNQFVDNAR